MLEGSGGIEVHQSAAGFSVGDDRPRAFWARITGTGAATANGTPYAFVEVRPAGAGKFTTAEPGRHGEVVSTAVKNPAYEVNDGSVTVGDIVLMFERGRTTIDTGIVYDFLAPGCCGTGGGTDPCQTVIPSDCPPCFIATFREQPMGQNEVRYKFTLEICLPGGYMRYRARASDVVYGNAVWPEIVFIADATHGVGWETTYLDADGTRKPWYCSGPAVWNFPSIPIWLCGTDCRAVPVMIDFTGRFINYRLDEMTTCQGEAPPPPTKSGDEGFYASSNRLPSALGGTGTASSGGRGVGGGGGGASGASGCASCGSSASPNATGGAGGCGCTSCGGEYSAAGIAVLAKPLPYGTRPSGPGMAGVPAEDWAEDIGSLINKSADETTSSDTTLSNDSELFFTMEANRRYRITLLVYFDCGDAGGADGFKYALTGPAAASYVRVKRRHAIPGSLGTPTDATDTAYTTSTGLAATAPSGGWVEMEILVLNGANAGTFAFQWSQNTSDTDATTVRAGSYLHYWQLA